MTKLERAAAKRARRAQRPQGGGYRAPRAPAPAPPPPFPFDVDEMHVGGKGVILVPPDLSLGVLAALAMRSGRRR